LWSDNGSCELGRPCRGAERDYVLEGGEVVESGTHEESMGEHRLYAELFGLQAASYTQGG